MSLIINLPFDGFYESLYSEAVDHEESQWIEYRCDDCGESGPDYEYNWPDELKLTDSELVNLLTDHTDYSAAYLEIAHWYVDAFDHVAGETFGMTRRAKRKAYDLETREFREESYDRPSIGLKFESMSSPREYNFETDRLFAFVSLRIMRELFKRSKAEKHATLAAVIRQRFTSRSGFISHYSNYLADWLAKPLADWDHNELATLLIATMKAAGFDADDDGRERLYYETVGDESAYRAWESAVDWPAFESARREARAEKLAEWRELDAEAAAHWLEWTAAPEFIAELGEEPAHVSARDPNQIELPF